MAKYTVIGLVDATTYEQIEAAGPVDAAERAEVAASVCHQCSQGLEVGEAYAVRVLGEDGDIVYTDERDEGLARQLADVERDRDELLVRVAELEASDDWQPIETAPRDGTWVLVWLRGEAREASWRPWTGLWWCGCGYLHGHDLPTHWRQMPGGPDDE